MSGYRKLRLKLLRVGVAAVALTSILLVLCGSSPATAGLSPTTQQFYGYVYNSDALVPAGYTITALVGATKVGLTYTDSQGRYGFDPVFEVTASPGQTVNFSINDHPSLQRVVFQGGIATNLNLTAYGAASQMPSTTCRTCGASGCSTACGISPVTLPPATVGSPYSVDLTAHGGVLPYTWSISGGTLPEGLSMDSIFGVIKGVPTTALTYSFTVRVDDSGSNYLTMETSIQVKGTTLSSQPSVSQGSVLTTAITSNFLGTTDIMNVTNNQLSEARELTNADRRVRLDLPAGTSFNLKGKSVISAGNESNPPPANDGSIAVCSYSFGPAGATFSPSVTMTLVYETPLPDGLTESGLYIAYWDGAAWNKLDSAVNTAAKEVDRKSVV
jgi:plastocyanin